MKKINWRLIEKPVSGLINCIEWQFEGELCGYEISMYQSNIGMGSFWQSIIRVEHKNAWLSKSCESKEECERQLIIGLLVLPVCRITGYYPQRGPGFTNIHNQFDGTGLV